MKTLNLIVIALFFSLPAFSTNPLGTNSSNYEIESPETIVAEVESRFKIITSEIEEISVTSLNQKIKVIILNDEFRKIRVEYVDNFEDIYNQSTLLPLINRSEFISTIYNVSYFMLRK